MLGTGSDIHASGLGHFVSGPVVSWTWDESAHTVPVWVDWAGFGLRPAQVTHAGAAGQVSADAAWSFLLQRLQFLFPGEEQLWQAPQWDTAVCPPQPAQTPPQAFLSL